MDNILTYADQLRVQGKPAALCIVISTSGSTPRKAGAKMIVFEDKKSTGTIGGGNIEKKVIDSVPDIIREGNPVRMNFELEDDLAMHCGGKMEVYIEPLTAMPKLYIFGAGHVGREVARVGLLAGFRITVFDERKGIFEQFGVENCTFVNDTYAKSIDVAVFDENTYNVIVTPKHEFDEAVLELVAKKPHAYTGMMGSRSKIAIIKKNYLDRGVFTEEEMKQIDMPIGIRFEAETPFEIAVSIMAKIIDTKNRKSKA